MYILGISAFYHDSAAALVIDGEIISAAQEERFSRKKHDPGYPKNAIQFVLNQSNLKLNEIDHIVFFEKPFLKFERILETYMAFAPKGFKSFSLSMPIWLREKLFQKKFLFEKLKQHDKEFNNIKKINFCEHHFSHASSAFYPSPFNEALVLTADGVGEWATTTVAVGKRNKLDIKKEIHFPHSLGLLYSAFTYYAGFKVNSGEYKLMGLAPYGNPIYEDKIRQIVDIKDDVYTVTVIEESAMLADGWATAFLAIGSAQGLKIAEKEKIAVIFFDKSEKKLIKITSNEFKKLK